MFDVLIIGGGPAALAAAIYFARQKMSFVILTENIGGQTLLSSDVENYLGFHLLDGNALVKKFREHLADYTNAFTLREQEPVTNLESINGLFRATTVKGWYDGKTVLIATGTKHRELGVAGEREYYGKGVTYCAACDAPLFREKVVTVVGGGNSAMDAALFTEKYAKRVALVTINGDLSGDEGMKHKVRSSQRITIAVSTKTTKIIGEKVVTGIGLVGADGRERIEQTDGVFIEIGLQPVVDFVGMVAKDRWGQIVIDKHNATSVPGIWAAGDVTDVTEKQIAVAVGEGSKAALEIVRYFQTTPITD